MIITTTEIIVRVAIALGLGAIIGLERTFAGKGAGMRTYAMVSLGACSFIIADLLASAGVFNVPGANPIVVEQAVISGIGFIGAGLIGLHGTQVSGLTTAAGIWIAAVIGIAVGFGFYVLAGFATFLTLFLFSAMWYWERKFKAEEEAKTQ